MAHQESQPVVTPFSGGPRKDRVPWVAKSVPDTERKQCVCRDPQCLVLIRRVFDETDPDHVWRKSGGFTEIKHWNESKPSPKVKALRRVIVHHLKLDSVAAQLKVFYVCNIHWPVAMLEAEGSGMRSTLLTSSEAQQLDEKCSCNNKFLDDKNCVGTLLESDELTKKKKSLKSKYVKAPVCRLDEVEEVLDAYSRAKNHRAMEDAAFILSSLRPASILPPHVHNLPTTNDITVQYR